MPRSRRRARERSRTASSSCSRAITETELTPQAAAFLDRWLDDVLGTPGLTALRDRAAARTVLLEDAMRAVPFVAATPGPIVDVGSGGGSPGVPLAVALPGRSVTLLEAERRKCEFLERITLELPNAQVTWGRAEEQSTEMFGVALAKALAKPPVATELCLPLVEAGGAVVLWVGPNADLAAVKRVAARIAGELEESDKGLLVLRKVGATPTGFPRRPGMAKKRPLA